AVRRIVIPLITAAITNVVDAITALNVGIAVEVVIHVHVDVVAAPAATPTPAAAPGGAHGQPDSERDRTGGDHRSGRWICIRRVIDWWIRISGRRVDVLWIVRWDVDDLRV